MVPLRDPSFCSEVRLGVAALPAGEAGLRAPALPGYPWQWAASALAAGGARGRYGSCTGSGSGGGRCGFARPVRR